MSFDITIPGGQSRRLLTGGKYCPDDIVVTATGSGAVLPVLSNPGGAGDLMEGKQLLDGAGVPVTGTFTLAPELAEQAALIDQIRVAVQSKTAGGAPEDLDAVLAEQETSIAELKQILKGKTGSAEADKLIEGSITEIDSDAAKIVGHAFYGIDTLTRASFPAAASIGSSAFQECSGLESATFENAASVGTYGFRDCTSLKRVDFGRLTSIGNNVFLNDAALETVIIRSSAVCTLGNKNSFTGTPIASGTGFVYFHSNLVDTHRAASNWSTYAAQIRAIEDYPEICGGEST